jgi:hypothetical protein
VICRKNRNDEKRKEGVDDGKVEVTETQTDTDRPADGDRA